MRLVPSPDWFVGADSVDLCNGDQWKDSVSLELFPYDAGTDSGFTFSSPNFETMPQDKITQVGHSAMGNHMNVRWTFMVLAFQMDCRSLAVGAKALFDVIILRPF